MVPHFDPSSLTAPKRARVLGVGIATLDIVNQVADYPHEDAEVRALSQRVQRGGNVTNTLAVLAQLGHRCEWLGTLADDAGAGLIRQDLARHGIGCGHCPILAGRQTPTSYIALSRATGSRTIIHHRDLRELTAADFAAVSLDGFDWVHFEGRHPVETAAMIADVRRRRPGLPVSVEIEKPRPGVEAVWTGPGGPDVLIFSRAYLLATGLDGTPEQALRRLGEATGARCCLLPWGEQGAYGLAAREGPLFGPLVEPLVDPVRAPAVEPVFAPAHRPPAVVDTLAAGDVFNAAAIDGLLRGLELPVLLSWANRLAGYRCGRQGLDGLVAGAAAEGLLGAGQTFVAD
ncbi:ketohexokinase [Thiohalocapsa marina]|uniref:Ketohexokinase n=1 Tax=Thiohalocapsa marina TaxID=424902 RepID=A0A5M8FL23_9GAMM|nr:PfkB family carbohydrate kinase [Thiohalocapsa marina]KAA6185407.1 ketohexokinase [Thiohalocapsa marina]